MIAPQLIDEVKHALAVYREVIARTKDVIAIEDYSNFAAKTDGLIIALENNNIADAKLRLYDMVMVLSDYRSRQPPEYRHLGDAIDKVRKVAKKM